MASASNTAEGGTHETTVTTGNSGGASGTAWNSTAIGGTDGTSLTYDNTAPAEGTLGYKVVTGSNTDECYLVWSTALGTLTTYYGRLYFLPASGTPAVQANLVNVRTGGSQAWRFVITTSRFLRIVDSAGSPLATGTVALSTTQVQRIEWKADHSAGYAEVHLYQSPNSRTPTEVLITATGQSLGASTDSVRIGKSGAQNHSPTWYMDAIKIDTAGWVGPYTANSGTPGNIGRPLEVGTLSRSERAS